MVVTPNKKGNLPKKVRNPVTGELINVGSKKYKYLMNKRVIVKKLKVRASIIVVISLV